MSTLMKKIEVYCSQGDAADIREYVSQNANYFEEKVETPHGDACRITFYAPVNALGEILDELRERLDLRRRDNMIVIVDVESGLGFPYRYGKRRLLSRAGLLTRPLEILIEEAEDKARIGITHMVLAMIAGVVALIGLFESNPYIVIGAMLVSPIIGPIYSAGIGIALGKTRLLFTSLYSLTVLLVSAFISALMVAMISYIVGASPRIGTPIVNYSTMVIPAVLGVAVIASEASNTLESLSGVAIAAALIPPLAATAYGLFYDPTISLNGAINVLSNVLFLVLVSGLTAKVILAERRR